VSLCPYIFIARFTKVLHFNFNAAFVLMQVFPELLEFPMRLGHDTLLTASLRNASPSYLAFKARTMFQYTLMLMLLLVLVLCASLAEVDALLPAITPTHGFSQTCLCPRWHSRTMSCWRSPAVGDAFKTYALCVYRSKPLPPIVIACVPTSALVSSIPKRATLPPIFAIVQPRDRNPNSCMHAYMQDNATML
jgi:hypothetical protein